MQDLQENRQLPLYQIGLSQMLPDMKQCTCTWVYLAYDKTISLVKTQEQIEELKTGILDTIAQVEAAKSFVASPSALCAWCDYEALCPARKHLIETSALTPIEFSQQDGVRLVDTYMVLKQRSDAATAETKWLERQIVEYADTKQMSALWGSDHKLRVWKGKGLRLPKKDEDQERIRVIADILKRHGLLEKYSSLQAFTLSKAIEQGQIPPAAVKELEPHLQFEEISRIYPTKLS